MDTPQRASSDRRDSRRLEVVFQLRAIVPELREAAVGRDVGDLARPVAVPQQQPLVRTREPRAGKVLRVGVDLGELLRAEAVAVIEVRLRDVDDQTLVVGGPGGLDLRTAEGRMAVDRALRE